MTHSAPLSIQHDLLVPSDRLVSPAGRPPAATSCNNHDDVAEDDGDAGDDNDDGDDHDDQDVFHVLDGSNRC